MALDTRTAAARPAAVAPVRSPGDPGERPGPAALAVEGLTKIFDGTPKIVAVDGVDFALAEGELFSLLGPSGCGKTTILRMVAGLEQPTGGRVLLAGADRTRTPTSARGVGMVFQNYALYPHMSVFENVAYGLRVRRLGEDAIRQKVSQALAMVRLPTQAQRRPAELSGGQQQRVALARALVYDPELLLFDEPLSNLDAKLRVTMRTEIRRIQKEAGIAAIYVTHDQEEALSISDRIAVMHEGRIAQLGSPTDIYENPTSLTVASFIGETNIHGAVCLEAGCPHALLRLASGETFAGRALGTSPAAGCAVHLLTRPERIAIAPLDMPGTLPRGTMTGVKPEPPAAPASRPNRLRARVAELVFLGTRTRYQLVTADGAEVTVDSVRLVDGVVPGAEVEIEIAPEDCLVVPRDAA